MRVLRRAAKENAKTLTPTLSLSTGRGSKLGATGHVARITLCLAAALALPLPLHAQTPDAPAGLSALIGPAATGAGAAAGPTSRPNQDTVRVDAPTQAVIDAAMIYLAAQQGPTGAWTNADHQAAITAYAMMAMMAAGNLPGEGPYAKNVQNGLQFLLSCQHDDGYIAAPTGQSNMYGHGIATIVLAELMGENAEGSEGSTTRLRQAVEKAVELIINAQNDAGGWRYTPHPLDADLSATVIQLVALRAAKNSGVDVPQDTIDRAVSYVKSCRDNGNGGFTYMPHTPAGFARTAAAIYSLQVCGLYDDPSLTPASNYLFAHRDDDREWFTYGNFYAAPAQYMIGGDTWTRWYTGMRDLLLPRAVHEQDGSCYWNPLEGNKYPSSEIYATSVYTIVLAMPYHFIPLYQR